MVYAMIFLRFYVVLLIHFGFEHVLTDNLAGVKVLHGIDKVMEGGAVVLTLKDQNILADGDINNGRHHFAPAHLYYKLDCDR